MLENSWHKKEKPLLGLTGSGGGVGSNLVGGGGPWEMPDYITNTDDLVYYIDMHTRESYPGSGTAIIDLSGASENYATTIEGTLDTDWLWDNSDDASSNPAWERIEAQHDGYIVTTNTSSSNLKFDTSAFTVEVWVRPHSGVYYFGFFSNNHDAVGGYQNSGGQNPSPNDPYFSMSVVGRGQGGDSGKTRIWVQPGHGYGTMAMSSSSNWDGYNSSSDQWGDWNHIVLTRSGATYKLYVNSNLEATMSDDHTNDFDGDNYAANFMDDSRSTSYDDFGRFGAARIYKGTALSSSDITAHYNGEKAAYGH